MGNFFHVQINNAYTVPYLFVLVLSVELGLHFTDTFVECLFGFGGEKLGLLDLCLSSKGYILCKLF